MKEKRMKVLQVMGSGADGGAETYFVDAVLALNEIGLDQAVFVRPQCNRIDLMKERVGKVYEAGFDNFLRFPTHLKMRKIIRDYKPDIIQYWMNRAGSYSVKGNHTGVAWFGDYCSLKHFKDCTYYVGVTPEIVEYEIKQGAPREKSRVIHTIAPESSREKLKRADFDTPEDAVVLLSLARLHERKAIDILIKAMKQVPSNVIAWIAGNGPLEEELKQLARDEGVIDRLRFLGWRDDRMAMLDACDICVFPSRYEPFGTVMVEAWAAKRPIVVCKSDGPRQYIKPYENGILVEIDDIDGLAKGINDCINDKELVAKLIAGGTKTYEEGFSTRKVAQDYLDFYQSIMAAQAK